MSLAPLLVSMMFAGLRSRWMIPLRCARPARRDLGAEAQHLVERQPSAAQPLGERLAFDQLHHEVVGLPSRPTSSSVQMFG